jgi:transcription elongation GreA/GreB family factor
MMSRAFAGDRDEQPGSELPELPLSPHPNYVTARGLAQLQARLADAQLRLAQVHGEDDDARLEQDYLGRHIRWLQARLAQAIPVAAGGVAPADRVAFGASVEVLDGRDRRKRYRIVGEDEADPDQGLVSWVSPLARALTGARVGDTVVWERPDGNVEVEVEDISFG